MNIAIYTINEELTQMARRKERYVTNVYWGGFILRFFHYLQDHNLGAIDYRIFFYFCEKMNTDDNLVRKKQITIAGELNIDKANVSRSLKKLCQLQFIAKVKTEGYMVNPHLLYAGNGYTLRKKLRTDFDALVDSPRFYMNEDDRILEDQLNPTNPAPWNIDAFNLDLS